MKNVKNNPFEFREAVRLDWNTIWSLETTCLCIETPPCPHSSLTAPQSSSL